MRASQRTSETSPARKSGEGGAFGLDAELGPGPSKPTTTPKTGGGLSSLTAGAMSSPGRSSALSDADAAVAIQSSYRGYKARKDAASFRRETTTTLMERQSKARIAEIQGVDPRAFALGSMSTNAANETAAATKIQAAYRGHAARREVARTTGFAGGGAAVASFRASSKGRALHLSGDAEDDSDLANRRAGTARGGGGGWAPHASLLERWEGFAARQRSRHIPVAIHPNGLRLSDAPRGYRMRVLAVEAYPFGPEAYRVAQRGNTLEVRASVSFFDEVTGGFHGATCSSVPEAVTLPSPAPGAPTGPTNIVHPRPPDPVGTLDVHHDVYFTTRVADPRRYLVVEIVFVEREGAAVVRETSGGWTAIASVGENGAEPSGHPNSAPVRSGTPRYLMWGRPRVDAGPPPASLGQAKVHFMFEPCPAFLAAAPLVPEDFPVTYGDVVPGVKRFDADGKQSTEVEGPITSTLASPLLAPLRRVALRGLCVSLPRGLVDVIAASPTTAVMTRGAAAQPLTPEALAANPAAAVNAAAGAKALSLRVAVHNGRRFVGAAVEADKWVAVEGATSVVQLAQDVVVEAVPEDVLVVLIVEVLFRQPGAPRSTPPTVLGWAPVCPFKAGVRFEADAKSGGLELRPGALEVPMRSTRGPRDEPPVNWRAVVQAAPDTWRHVVRYGGPETDALAVAFELAPAAGDLGGSGVKAEARDAARALLDVQDRAALTIQANVRGHQARVSSDAPGATEEEKRLAELRRSIPNLALPAPASTSADPTRVSLSAERAKAEAALTAARAAADRAVAGVPAHEDGANLLGVLAEQQAKQLGAMSSLQQAQLAQVAALAGDDRTLTIVQAQQQQQLAQLAAAMQAQLDQLAKAIGSLNRSTDNLRGLKGAAAAGVQGQGRDDAAAPSAWDSALTPAAEIDALTGREWPLDVADQDASGRGPAEQTKATARSLFSGGIADGSDWRGKKGSSASDRLGGFTRATRARLHAAGADATLPPDVRRALRAGAAAEATKRSGPPPPPPDLAKERRDIRAVNEVIVQFLAYRKLDALNATVGLEKVHFTFDFFDFPASTSRTCALTPSDAKPGEPQLLVPAGAPRDARSFAAGASSRAGEAWFKFCVDGAGNGAGDRVPDGHEAMHARRCDFVEYLAKGTLHVDVWDGDSLMQHGTAAIDLAGLLRQGRESAEVLMEAPVLDHRESVSEEAAKGRKRRAALAAARGATSAAGASSTGGGVARGALLVRLINVGRAPDPSLMPPPAPGGDANGGRGLSRGPGGHPRRVRVRAVPEEGGELAAALRGGALVENVPPGNDSKRTTENGSHRGGNIGARRAAARDGDRSVLQQQEARKLSREARLREIRGGDGVGAGGGLASLAGAGGRGGAAVQYPEDEAHAVRGKLLDDIDAARRRAKRAAVLRTLRAGLAARRTLRPAYGELCFFEHEFTSPVSRDCVFEVRCDDPDLMLVASAEEWKALRGASGLPAGVAGIEDEALAGNRLFLLGRESIKVPFKFQSFTHDADVTKNTDPDAAGLHLRARTIAVHFVNAEDGSSAGVLHVDVRPTAMRVARTFRFQASEHDFFKARLPAPPGVPTRDADGLPCMAVRASDPAVAIGVADPGMPAGVAAGEEITLRYKCGGYPEGPTSTSFYVLVYGDRFLGTLAAVWRVFVHAVPRVDLSALVGQTMHTSVVVQGGKETRRVAAFSSHPDELQVAPDRLLLPAGALTEVQVAFRPLVPGRLDVMIHLVDLERNELVHSRLAASDARAPTVSKTFEVDLSPGIRAHKKITYTNPYPRPRAFYLRCTHPLLLHFRPERLDLPANGSRPMGLTFEPAEEWAVAAKGGGGANGPTDVLVFINDEEDATEECFRVRVNANTILAAGARR